MRKVFIVEDDRFISAIFTMFLRDLGHELVGKTSSGKDAIEMCQELKPDVVLMDIHLEGELDGIQTAEMLKREIDIPIIYISSDTTSHVIERAIVANSYGYLVKPINKKELGIGIDLAYYKHKVDLEQRQRELGYREFISDSPLPIIVLYDDKITYLNRLGLDIFKTHYIEDIIGMPMTAFIHEESRAEFKKIMDIGIGQDKRIKPFVAKMLDVHGAIYWAEITGSKVHFNNRQSVQLIIKNITIDQMNLRKVKVLEDLLFSENRMCLLLDHNFEVLKSNAYTHKELEIDNVVGKKMKELFNVVDSDLNEIVNNSDISRANEIKILMKNDERKLLHVRVVETYGENKHVIFLIEKL